MKTKLTLIKRAALLVLLSILDVLLSTAFAQGTAFTYQGQLQNNGSPANGSYDLTFTLFNTNLTGVPITGPVTDTAVGRVSEFVLGCREGPKIEQPTQKAKHIATTSQLKISGFIRLTPYGKNIRPN